MRRVRALSWAFLVFAGFAFAQASEHAAKLSFEVVSVKPVASTFFRGAKTENSGRFEYGRISVFSLLLRAYGLKAYQVTGPRWIRDNYYEVRATIPKGATQADIPEMLRGLLAERFRLSVHWESRPTPVYAITVAEGGPKLQACELKEKDRPRTLEDPEGPLHRTKAGECPSNRAVSFGEESLRVEANTLAYLAVALQGGSDRPVFDRTGLQGNFVIQIECQQQRVQGADDTPLRLPFMSTALKKLGLRLEPRSEKIQYLVVDSGERNPIPN